MLGWHLAGTWHARRHLAEVASSGGGIQRRTAQRSPRGEIAAACSLGSPRCRRSSGRGPRCLVDQRRCHRRTRARRQRARRQHPRALL
eukprot:scaffold43075_cov39-Phaeocystis_antarctica.AAC.1